MSEPEVTYDSIGRKYRFPGAKGTYYSVTTMISATADKTFLEKWRKEVGEATADRLSALASAYGTRFHEYCQTFLESGQTPKFSPYDMDVAGLAFRRAMPVMQQHLKVIRCEVPLWSDALQLAGRCDCIGYWDGVLSIIDFKLVKSVYETVDYEDYRHQCSIYAAMLDERTSGRMSPRRFVVFITPKDGSPVYTIVDEPAKHFADVKERIRRFRAMIGC